MAFLEINDWQLTLRDAQGATTLKETAGASTAGGKLEFGQAALRHSRSHPQQFNNKYFYSLAADPISGDLKPAKNHADLIYHHLTHLGLPADESLAVCVSGHVTNQQLGLLLGICQEAELRVAGFIDTALAQSLSAPTTGSYHVLDIELHRITVSEIEVKGDSRELRQTVTMDGLGVANIIEGWMNVIADEFVQKTRFDPLHAGQSEQQLFDQVSAWLARPQLEDQRISVANGESSRDIEIGHALLLDKLRQRLRGFDFDHMDQLAITPRAAAIPGLKGLLDERVSTVLALSAVDIPHNLLTLARDLDPQNVRRITSARYATASTPPKAESKRKTATHLLAESIARGLHDALFADAIDPATARTLSTEVVVNGSPALDVALLPGDSVIIDEKTYTAIRVE